MELDWPHQIKAVLLDHDDTLVNTFAACMELNKHVARTWYGKELTDEDISAHWNVPITESVRRIFDTDDTELAQQRILECYPLYPKKLIGQTVTKKLKFAGIPVGIVSSSSRQLVAYDLARADVQDDISYLQTEEDTPYHKPDPQVFDPTIKWLEQCGISPAQTLYVGDTLNDGHAATQAGFAFVGVTTGAFRKGQFTTAGFSSLVTVEQVPGLLGL